MEDNTSTDTELEERTASHKDAVEGGFFVSATKGDGLKELQLKIQEEVLQATQQKFYKIVVPAEGQQLKCVCCRCLRKMSYLVHLVFVAMYACR